MAGHRVWGALHGSKRNLPPPTHTHPIPCWRDGLARALWFIVARELMGQQGCGSVVWPHRKLVSSLIIFSTTCLVSLQLDSTAFDYYSSFIY